MNPLNHDLIVYRVPVNIVPVVYCAAISEGTSQDWDFLWEKFRKADVAAEQIVILGALGCTKDSKVLWVRNSNHMPMIGHEILTRIFFRNTWTASTLAMFVCKIN